MRAVRQYKARTVAPADAAECATINAAAVITLTARNDGWTKRLRRGSGEWFYAVGGLGTEH